MNDLKRCPFYGEHPWYCLKIDIPKLFYCIPHDKELDMLRSIIDDESIIELMSTNVNVTFNDSGCFASFRRLEEVL